MQESSLTVLVVEDHEDAATPLCALLEAEGYRCWSATTGAEALRLAAEHRPQVLLLDIELPDMSGLEVLHRLQEGDGFGDCRAVAITGHDDEGTRDACRSEGVRAFFAKPVDPEELLVLMAALEES